MSDILQNSTQEVMYGDLRSQEYGLKPKLGGPTLAVNVS